MGYRAMRKKNNKSAKEYFRACGIAAVKKRRVKQIYYAWKFLL